MNRKRINRREGLRLHRLCVWTKQQELRARQRMAEADMLGAGVHLDRSTKDIERFMAWKKSREEN